MDILIIAVAIFGLSSLVNRVSTCHQHFVNIQVGHDTLFPHLSTTPLTCTTHNNNHPCVTTWRPVYQSKLNFLSVPDVPVKSPISSYNEPVYRKIFHKRKTRRGTRGGRNRRIQVHIQDRPSPLPYFKSNIKQPNLRNLTYINCEDILIDNSTTLKAVYLNARSCNNKTIEINDLIVEKNADLVFISETWLRPYDDNITLANLLPNGFQVININRQSGCDYLSVFN